MNDLEMDTIDLLGVSSDITAAAKVAAELHSANGIALMAVCQAAGDTKSAGALAHFVDQWSYGAGHLHDDSTTLAQALQQCVSAIVATDTKLGQALGVTSK